MYTTVTQLNAKTESIAHNSTLENMIRVVRVALKGNPIDLFHPHLLAPENSVYCGQADIINALKVDIIGNDFVSDLPESDEVVLTNHIHNEGFLCRCKYGNPPTSMWHSFNSKERNMCCQLTCFTIQ